MPPYFVDRPPAGAVDGCGLVASMLSALRNGPVDPRFRQVVSAARGMGKTALARHVATRATAELGWLSAVHHCPSRGASLATLAAELSAMLGGEQGLTSHTVAGHTLAGHTLAGHTLACHALAGFGPAVRYGQRPECACSCRRAHPAGRSGTPETSISVARGGTADLFEVVTRAGRCAAAKGNGILIVLDDCDRLSLADREALAGLAAHLYRADLPVALLAIASEPGEPLVRAAADAGALWHEVLGTMSVDESVQALTVPAARRGVSFSGGALDAMQSFAAGSPLAVQKVGFAVWSGTGRSNHIGTAAARDALDAMSEQSERKAS